MQCHLFLTVGELHGHGLVTPVHKNENLFCERFGQIYENLHQQKFNSHYMVYYTVTRQFAST